MKDEPVHVSCSTYILFHLRSLHFITNIKAAGLILSCSKYNKEFFVEVMGVLGNRQTKWNPCLATSAFDMRK